MLCILGMGGFTTGGVNFDAKVRRESFEPIDLFHAHIGGMDAFARGLKIAHAIIADGRLADVRQGALPELGQRARPPGRVRPGQLRRPRGLHPPQGRRRQERQRPAGDAREPDQRVHLICAVSVVSGQFRDGRKPDDLHREGRPPRRLLTSDKICSRRLYQRREDPLHEGGQVVGGPAGDEVAVADAGGVLPDAAGVLDVVADREEAGDLPALQACAEQSIQGPWQIAARTLPCWAAWVTRSTIAGCRRMWSGE